MYVALTRARDHLHVTVPQRFYHRRFAGSREHSYALPSRFLTPAVDRFAPVVAGVPDEPEGEERRDLFDDADPVGGLLQTLWK